MVSLQTRYLCSACKGAVSNACVDGDNLWPGITAPQTGTEHPAEYFEWVLEVRTNIAVLEGGRGACHLDKWKAYGDPFLGHNLPFANQAITGFTAGPEMQNTDAVLSSQLSIPAWH